MLASLRHLKLREDSGKIFAVLMVLLNCYAISRAKDNFITNLYQQTVIYQEKYNDFISAKNKRKEALTEDFAVKSDGRGGVYVLVIGESQSRDHMSAYGYGRKTTPWLDSVKNTERFCLFERAFSCHTHTVPVLTYALTAKNQYNNMNLDEAVSIIEVAESAGFQTAWISNQVKYSAWDTPITAIAGYADQQLWLNSNIGETTLTQYYDEALVPRLKSLEYSDKMLIVVHLMGNHGAYTHRCPPSFKNFSGNKNIDDYDNSILYNDYVMKLIFDAVKNIPGFQAMVYFADHADDADRRLGHEASKFTDEMTHIPLYMYFSPEYASDRRKTYETLLASRKKPFTNDLVFNALTDIMGIEIPRYRESQNDIASPDYDDSYGRFVTLYGTKSLDAGTNVGK